MPRVIASDEHARRALRRGISDLATGDKDPGVLPRELARCEQTAVR